MRWGGWHPIWMAIGATLMSYLRQWGLFLRVVLDPWTIMFVASTYVLIRLSADNAASSAPSQTLNAVLGVAVAVTAGVVGALLLKTWLELTERSALVARGHLAIRNLDQLLSSI